MPGTNFDLAPPVKTVDGLLVVPIDIQQIAARLTFDGATSSGSGDATLDFIVGPQAGNPIFDLRQTITDAWLDGAPVPVAQLAHHDFGGGPNAELRVLESPLAAGSAHSLRVTYSLGPPQASTAGSYQPAMTWSVGPRLAFNFGFTDLGAGRYLEAWVPANLIFDQFQLTLEVQVVGTAVAHSVITNGAVTDLGPNHWSIAFPDRFTALSTLLEVRASDTLATLTQPTTLPVSGTVVNVEAWKPTTSAVDLPAEIASVKTWLAENETAIGHYLHGGRFVVFFNVGGMEYEGGATTSTSSARHETYHSWWGRGVKPAAQPDGWWDEAWNVYHDNGGVGSLPFDLSQPPVELSTRNPWSRITPGAAYTTGERVFEGAAAAAGIAGLAGAMSAFYMQRRGRLATTMDLESFLVCRTGKPVLVDGFHRFVYGFADPSPPPDLWLRDDPAHTGADSGGGPFWNSPDLWIRKADDGGTTHQPPEFGQDNWFYARVRNRSATATARHYLVTFNVKPFAGIEFVYPTDFLPCIAAIAGFELAPGDSAVVRARWPAALVPPPGTHACWLAAVLTRGDPPAPGAHVWEHNNLAQKNLTIVDLLPNAWIVIPFLAQDVFGRLGGRAVFELVRPKGREELEAWLLEPKSRRREPPVEALLDCGAPRPIAAPARGMWTSDGPETAVAAAFPEAKETAFPAGPSARIPIKLEGLPSQRLLGLRLHVPRDAKAGERLLLDLVQRDSTGKRRLGGLAVEIRVAKGPRR